MKILVIGGAGYIGSHFIIEASKLGHDLTVFDDLSSGFKDNLDKSIPFYKGSTLILKDIYKVMELEKFDVVVHLAAFKAAGESMLNPAKYTSSNIIGGLNVIKACMDNNIEKILFSSSAAVYGTPQYIPIDEMHPVNPINYYGYTKFVIEQNLKWYSELKGLKFASLRYFNAAGYDSNQKFLNIEKNPQNLIPVVMECAAGIRKKLEVFGDDYSTKDGTGVRDYIHVSDLARGHLDSIDYLFNKNKNLIINLGTGNGFSVLEVINATEKISNKSIDYSISSRREGDPDTVIASAKKAEKLINWLPKKSDLENIISSTWEMYNK